MSTSERGGHLQLELPFGEAPMPVEAPLVRAVPPVAQRTARTPALPQAPARPGLRVIQGGGQRRQERLASRDAVVRVLLEAGADMLLRRISPERAETIEAEVDQILALFDRVDATPALLPVLERRLDGLEALMTETRASRSRRPG